MSGHHDRVPGPPPAYSADSTLTARGHAIQNVSFFTLVALTTLTFLGLIASFVMPVFWAAVLATVFFPLQRRLPRTPSSSSRGPSWCGPCRSN